MDVVCPEHAANEYRGSVRIRGLALTSQGHIQFSQLWGKAGTGAVTFLDELSQTQQELKLLLKKWVATHLRVQVIGVVWESRKSATLPACSQTPRPALILFSRVFGPEFELAMSSLITLSLYLIFFFFLRYNLYLNIKLKMRLEWRPPGIKQSLPLQHWGSQAVSWGLASCAEKQCSVLTHVWEAPYWAISQTWTAAGHSLRQTPAPYHHNVNSSSTKGHWWLWETDALHFPQISSF